MDVKLVEEGVAILGIQLVGALLATIHQLTFDTDAVNTTTSYSSPTRFMN